MQLLVILSAFLTFGLSGNASTFFSDPSKIAGAFFEKLEHGSDLYKDLEWEAEVEGKKIPRRKSLAWMIEHDQHYILIFQSVIQSWPGGNGVTVVLTDRGLNSLDWLRTEEEPMFHWAYLSIERNRTELRILSKRRGLSDVPMVYTILVEKDRLTESSSGISKETRIGKRVY